jgi:hypothetical protein
MSANRRIATLARTVEALIHSLLRAKRTALASWARDRVARDGSVNQLLTGRSYVADSVVMAWVLGLGMDRAGVITCSRTRRMTGSCRAGCPRAIATSR